MPMNERLWALYPESAQSILNELTVHLSPAAGRDWKAEPSVFFSSGDEADRSVGYALKNGVAVIDVFGPITRKTQYSFWSGAPVSAGQDEIARSLDKALQDRAVRSILLNFNSPGGTVPGTKELADRIAEAAKRKPMAAYADGLMASAAMWLAAAAGRVYAPVTATVGSIGVLMVHADFSRMNDKYGVTYTYITGGRLKAVGNQEEPLSDEARDFFQRQVSQIHEIFKADVIRGLGISAAPERWAEGQTLLAEEAESVGLVTQIVRDIDSAITMLSQEAKMDYQTFAAQHPDLLAEIENKAEARAAEKVSAQSQSAVKEAQRALLAMVKAVAGEEVMGKVEKLAAAGIKAEQLEALSSLLSPPAAEAAPDAKAAILAGLKAATPAAVTGGLAAAPAKSKLLADAERRAAGA